MKVLSLFDGMSCGQIALNKIGITDYVYYASEIEKSSIAVTQRNYPSTVQLGDILELDERKLKRLNKIDLLLGGSPCQNLTITVADREEHFTGLAGDKSKLFFEYVRALKTVEPKYFLYENVESMKEKDKETITKNLGVEPIMIDSGLLSAQERKRYYWTNIPNVKQPNERHQVLADILEENVDEKYYYNLNYDFYGLHKRVAARLDLYNYDILKRVYSPHFKAPTLTACRGGHKQKKVIHNDRVRKLTPLEYERLQTVPEGYTKGVADSHRYNMLGDGWTVDVIAHILSYADFSTSKGVQTEAAI
ncbi:DNA (cytosine-5-)-methyltransferase [Bacillus sp. ChL18]|uniref:DNA (cytosine-5-)-methyltransferase n=1 Tax=Bacillus TaxID=1386 RepID=UPI0022496BFA|nr:DNA (cytosine-5-)-methyltransferase [Bacillus sp. ChL18]MCX2809588.1 DNA (cytosine-5-)-methyltransferase [Bacillus sp. ChL18]